MLPSLDCADCTKKIYNNLHGKKPSNNATRLHYRPTKFVDEVKLDGKFVKDKICFETTEACSLNETNGFEFFSISKFHNTPIPHDQFTSGVLGLVVDPRN